MYLYYDRDTQELQIEENEATSEELVIVFLGTETDDLVLEDRAQIRILGATFPSIRQHRSHTVKKQYKVIFLLQQNPFWD